MKKTKVIQIITGLTLGGAQRVIQDIVQRLPSDQFESEVISLFDYTKSSQPHIADELQQAGIPVRCFNFADDGIRAYWQLWQHLRIQKPDAIHCHLPFAAVVGTVIGRLAGAPSIIAHEHNEYRFYSSKLRFALKATHPLRSLTICYSTAVEEGIFGKVHLLEHPENHYPERSYTIRNGVSLSAIDEAKKRTQQTQKRQEIGIEPDAQALICVARLIDWKGQETLIEAFKHIIHQWPKAVLLIVGYGPNEPRLREVAGDLIGNRIHFLGGRMDAYELLSASDIYSAAYTYADDFPTKEAIGVASLEAMAIGIPVIISDYPSAHGELPESLHPFLVPPKDINALAKRLEELLASQEKRTLMGTEGRKHVERCYAWEQLIHIYESLYQSFEK